MKTPKAEEFTCPKCGSHSFGSSKNTDGSLQRYCHGYIHNKPMLEACSFNWHEKNDHKYLK